jgi:hypothetical protein
MFETDLYGSAMTGGLFAALAGFFVLFMIIGILFYVYFALALMTIAKKRKEEPAWLAWIPYANIALVLKMGGFHWAWVFLLLAAWIPILGWLAGIALMVLCFISFWRIAEKRDFPGWTVLLVLIPFVGGIWGLVLLGILAWKK